MRSYKGFMGVRTRFRRCQVGGMSESDWLEKYADEIAKYKGLWVGVSKSGLVTYGETAKKVHDEASRKTGEPVIVFRVPTKDEETHVLRLCRA